MALATTGDLVSSECAFTEDIGMVTFPCPRCGNQRASIEAACTDCAWSPESTRGPSDLGTIELLRAGRKTAAAGIVICALANLPGAYLVVQLLILDLSVFWMWDESYVTGTDSSPYLYLPYALAAIIGLAGLVVCSWRVWSIRFKLKALQQRPSTTPAQQ